MSIVESPASQMQASLDRLALPKAYRDIPTHSKIAVQQVRLRSPSPPTAASEAVTQFVITLDADNDDYITFSDIQKFLSRYQDFMPADLLQQMFDHADYERLGKINAQQIVKATSGRYQITAEGSVWQKAPYREQWIKLLQLFATQRGVTEPILDARSSTPLAQPEPIAARFEEQQYLQLVMTQKTAPAAQRRLQTLSRSFSASPASFGSGGSSLNRSHNTSALVGAADKDGVVMRTQKAQSLLRKAAVAEPPREIISTSGPVSVAALTQRIAQKTAPGGAFSDGLEDKSPRAKAVHEYLRQTEVEMSLNATSASHAIADPSLQEAMARGIDLDSSIDPQAALFSFESQAQFNAVLRLTAQQSDQRRVVAAADTASSKAKFAETVRMKQLHYARKLPRADEQFNENSETIRSRALLSRPATSPLPMTAPLGSETRRSRRSQVDTAAAATSPRLPDRVRDHYLRTGVNLSVGERSIASARPNEGFVTAFHIDNPQALRTKVARDQGDMRGEFQDPSRYQFRPEYDPRTEGKPEWHKRVGRRELPLARPMDVRPRETIMKEVEEREKEQTRAKLAGKPELVRVFHLPSHDRQLGAPDQRHQTLEKEPFPPPTSYIAYLDRKARDLLALKEPEFKRNFRTLRPTDRENMGLQVSKKGDIVL